MAQPPVADAVKVLFVTNLLPYPLRDGGRIRRYHLAAALSAEHEVWMIGAAPDRRDLKRFARVAPRITVVEIPYRPGDGPIPVAEKVRELVAREAFEVLHIAGLWQWPGEAALGGARVVLDAENVESLLLRRIRAVDAGKLSALDIDAVEALERQALRRADRVLACSAVDAQALARLEPAARVAVVPNGVDLRRFRFAPRRPDPGRVRLAFTGALAYWPNADACVHFVHRILPLLRRGLPAASLRIVGRYPPREVVNLAAEAGVEVLHDVPDIRPYLRSCDVVVVPLRAASGTRLKILEAWALGRPVVTTPVGCEGLEATDGVHLVVASDPEEFARAVARLVLEPERTAELVRRGRRLVEDRYGWESIGAGLRQCYRELEGA